MWLDLMNFLRRRKSWLKFLIKKVIFCLIYFDEVVQAVSVKIKQIWDFFFWYGCLHELHISYSVWPILERHNENLHIIYICYSFVTLMVISLKHNCYFFLKISYYPPTHPGQKNNALSLNLCRPHALYRNLKIW